MNNVLRPVLAVVLTVALSVAASAQTNLKVDPVHSFVVFKVQHLGVSSAWGRFNNPEGTIVWDDADPSKSRIDLTLQSARVDTGNQKRDDHLRSPDFFNARQFPTIIFKSTSITASGENQYQVNGDLTLHGVTRPLTVTLVKTGEASTQNKHVVGFESSFKIKRSDFGMNFMQNGLGDEVDLMVNLEVIRQ